MDVPAIPGKMVTQELREGMVTLDSLVMMVHQAAQDLMVNLDKEVLRDREVKTGNLGQMVYLAIQAEMGIQDSRVHQVHRDFQVVQVSPEVKVNKDSPDFQVSRVNQVKEDHKESLVALAKMAFPVKMD